MISGSCSPEVYKAMQHQGDASFYSFWNSQPEQKFLWHNVDGNCNYRTEVPMNRLEFEEWLCTTHLSDADAQKFKLRKQVGIIGSAQRSQLDKLNIEYSTDTSTPEQKYIWHLGALRDNGRWSFCGWAEQTKEPITRAEYMKYCTELADIGAASRKLAREKQNLYFASINGKTIQSCTYKNYTLHIQFTDGTTFTFFEGDGECNSTLVDKDDKVLGIAEGIPLGYD